MAKHFAQLTFTLDATVLLTNLKWLTSTSSLFTKNQECMKSVGKFV